jgi:hypothetical protein
MSLGAHVFIRAILDDDLGFKILGINLILELDTSSHSKKIKL